MTNPILAIAIGVTVGSGLDALTVLIPEYIRKRRVRAIMKSMGKGDWSLTDILLKVL